MAPMSVQTNARPRKPTVTGRERDISATVVDSKPSDEPTLSRKVNGRTSPFLIDTGASEKDLTSCSAVLVTN